MTYELPLERTRRGRIDAEDDALHFRHIGIGKAEVGCQSDDSIQDRFSSKGLVPLQMPLAHQ
jgi:hypothetical protein